MTVAEDFGPDYRMVHGFCTSFFFFFIITYSKTLCHEESNQIFRIGRISIKALSRNK